MEAYVLDLDFRFSVAEKLLFYVYKYFVFKKNTFYLFLGLHPEWTKDNRRLQVLGHSLKGKKASNL